MDKADDEKVDPADSVQRAECDAICREHVGDEHDDGRQKLQKRAVDALDLMDGLVEQDDGRVKHRPPRPKKMPLRSSDPRVSPMPVMSTRPSVDMTKQRNFFPVSFSWKRMGQTSVTMTGAK